MPEMDGITATKLIRRFYESRRDERPLRPSVIGKNFRVPDAALCLCFVLFIETSRFLSLDVASYDSQRHERRQRSVFSGRNG